MNSMNPMHLSRRATTNGAARDDDDAAAGPAGRPLAHAIALRLLTAKGADAVGLKGYAVRAGLAEAMVDVLEELTRRVRGLRVEFEDLATTARAATPAGDGAPVPPAIEPTAPQATAPRTINPGW